MLSILNGQIVSIKFGRTIVIQTITNEDRYRAARVFGIRDSVAQAMIKGLCYTPVKIVTQKKESNQYATINNNQHGSNC